MDDPHRWCCACGSFRRRGGRWRSPHSATRAPIREIHGEFNAGKVLEKIKEIVSRPPKDVCPECATCVERYEGCDMSVPPKGEACSGYTVPGEDMICPVCTKGTVYDEGHYAYCNNELCDIRWEI